MNRPGTFLSQCLPLAAGEPCCRRLPAFDVDQAVCAQQTTCLKLLADIRQQVLCEGRIEENYVEVASTAGDEGRGLHRVAVCLTGGLQCSQGCGDPVQDIRVAVDKGTVRGAAR